jgi:hypothetical protein
MIANLGYTLAFGAHDHAILARSLIADIALPVLLLAHIPAFFTRHHELEPSRPSTPARLLPRRPVPEDLRSVVRGPR